MKGYNYQVEFNANNDSHSVRKHLSVAEFLGYTVPANYMEGLLL